MDRLPTVREPGAPEVPRRKLPSPVPVIPQEEELFAPSPYAGMSMEARRTLTETILRETFEGEAWMPSGWEAPTPGGEEVPEDEDWPSELHPLHGASHRD